MNFIRFRDDDGEDGDDGKEIFRFAQDDKQERAGVAGNGFLVYRLGMGRESINEKEENKAWSRSVVHLGLSVGIGYLMGLILWASLFRENLQEIVLFNHFPKSLGLLLIVNVILAAVYIFWFNRNLKGLGYKNIVGIFIGLGLAVVLGTIIRWNVWPILFGAVWSLTAVCVLVNILSDKTIDRLDKFVRYYRLIGWLIFGAGVFYVLAGLSLHYNFRTSAFDLGIYDQTLWMMSKKASLGNTLNGFGSAFGAHFQPILFLLAPFYWLFGRAETLIFVEIIVNVLAALAVWRISSRHFSNSLLCFSMVFAYLFFVGTQKALAYPFHPSSFIAPLMLFAFDYFEQRKWLWHGLFMGLVMATKENSGLYVACFGFFILVSQKKYWKLALFYMTAGLVWMWSVVNLIMSKINSVKYNFFTFEEIGADSGEFVKTFLSNPLYVFKVMFGNSAKLWTIFSYLAGGGFLMIFTPYVFLMLPNFVEKMLSSRPEMWGTTFHYGGPMAFGFIISLIFGIERLAGLLEDRKLWSKQKILAGAALFIVLCTSILIVNQQTLVSGYLRGLIKNEINAGSAVDLREKICDYAKVSAQGPIVPHFSGREFIYDFPNVRDAEYVILDPLLDAWPVGQQYVLDAIESYKNSPQWQVYYQKDDFWVFRRAVIVGNERGK